MSNCPPDSPLSTAANITGILTFALGIVSFCAAFYAITYNASQEIRDCNDSLREMKAHINQIAEYFEELKAEADSELEHNPIKQSLDKSLNGLKTRRQKIEQDLSHIAGRLQWWYRRQDGK